MVNYDKVEIPRQARDDELRGLVLNFDIRIYLEFRISNLEFLYSTPIFLKLTLVIPNPKLLIILNAS